jgi:hypothetical protein
MAAPMREEYVLLGCSAMYVILWRWRWHVLPKCWTVSRLYSITTRRLYSSFWTLTWSLQHNFMWCLQYHRLLHFIIAILSCRLFFEFIVKGPEPFKNIWGYFYKVINFLFFVVLYNSSAWSQLQYISCAWNSVILTASFKLEKIERKFANLCHSRYVIGTCDNRYNDA